MIIEDVLDSIRSAETRLLDADGRVALWHTLQDAMAEIKRLRGLLGSATLSAATEDKPVAWSVLESPQPALTDAERKAVEKSERMARLEGYDNDAATLRGLLHRLG
jgi:hypothetical protein